MNLLQLCLISAVMLAKSIATAFVVNTKPIGTSSSFGIIQQHRCHVPCAYRSTKLDSKSTQDTEVQQRQEDDVQVGTKEYYSGFISRKIDEEPEERITGDAVLVPTLKFVGGFAAVLIVLFFGFLASNGLI